MSRPQQPKEKLSVDVPSALETNRPDTDDHFTVMAYNVNFGLILQESDFESPYSQSIIDTILSEDSEIVCLTETTDYWQQFFNTNSELRKRYPHQLWFSPERFCAEGQAILSRFPITHYQRIDAPSQWFYEIIYQVQLSPDRILQILNAHMRPSLSSGAWYEHPKEFLKAYQDRLTDMKTFCKGLDPDKPFIIAGDFNESHEGVFAGATVEWLLSDFNCGNAIHEFARNQTTWKWPVGWFTLEACFDHIFYSKKFFTPEEGHVTPKGASDHYPVVARFLWKPTIQ